MEETNPFHSDESLVTEVAKGSEDEDRVRFTEAGRRIYDFGQPYVPERDYLGSNYLPIGESEEHFCSRCKDYYCDLYKSKLTRKEFPPKCEGDIAQNIQRLLDSGEIDEEDAEYLLYRDPITFAAAEFNWVPRWYQKEMLRCSSQKKIVRAGRRVGKSVAMAVKIVHVLYTHSNYNILVICPYQSQVKRVFDIIRTDLMTNSISFNESVVRDNTSAPQVIELANGSKVTGFSSGAKSGGKSTQIRGQDAHAIFLDEMDYLSEDDFEAVLAILASHPDCLLWASSTPTGARSQFFEWATRKDLGFKEFHFISSESPSWTADTEEFLRERYSEAGYGREFLAEFGDETMGVFKNSDINASLVNYDYKECEWNPNLKYIMGVDWNETSGVHIVIVQLSGGGPGGVTYKIVVKEVVEKQMFTQHKAVERIISLDAHWHCKFIYVDAGFGNTQIEMLQKFGMENPATRMHKRVKPVAMQSKISIRDPVTGQEVKKDAKPFMVGIAARQVEMRRCVLPRHEDTSVNLNEEGEIAQQVGIVQQMRNFRVEKLSKFGMPTYSQGFEHTLTAWMLALMGFFMEYSDINRVATDLQVQFVGRMGEYVNKERKRDLQREKAEAVAETKKMKKKYVPTGRGMSDESVFKIGGNSGTRAILERDRRIRKMDADQFRKAGYIKPPRRIGRKTF